MKSHREAMADDALHVYQRQDTRGGVNVGSRLMHVAVCCGGGWEEGYAVAGVRVAGYGMG